MKRVLTAGILFVLVALVLPISGQQSPASKPTEPQGPADALAIRDAHSRGGLREVARLKGKYVVDYDPHWDLLIPDIETLTRDSVGVVVGRVTKKLNARLLEGRVIFTEYEVKVDEVIKGNVKQGQSIIVMLPGGRVEFEDGTSAEQITTTFEQPRIGRAYTLFLMEERVVPSVFFLYGGPEGVFDIEDRSSVKSHGKPGDPCFVEAKGQTREQFLENVRKQVRTVTR